MMRVKKRYRNLDDVNTTKTFRELQKWRKERRAKRKDLSYRVPQADTSGFVDLITKSDSSFVTWVGHATFVFRFAGLTILTDPVWAERMGLEKRLAPPGIRMEQLPAVDVVLLSHGHYDHLDIPTLRRLPGNPLLLVPAGLRSMLNRKGFARAEELEWWESRRIGEAEFVFVPAQHWTRRTLGDMNTSHWGGWVLRAAEEPAVYFAGDSGYFRGFREIGRRYQPDYVLMPIGAYEPEWFMSAQHVSPEEAVQAFLDAEGTSFIPMHYGAFRLADDTPKEALDRLHAEWERRSLAPERLIVLAHGESLALKKVKAPVRI